MTRRRLLGGGLAVAGLGALGTVVGTARADALAGPEIVDTAGWAARPSRLPVTLLTNRPVKILVHHTATPNVADTSRGAADELARAIQRFHMDRRGWLDSGQHFTISRGGFVLEGRHRSLEALHGGKRQVQGAHCTGQNNVSVGIENEGTYVGTDVPDVLWARLREMCAYICGRYGIRPTEIYGHRDYRDTACPGDRLYAQLPRLRAEVAGLLGAAKEGRAEGRADRATWPLLRPGDTGRRVRAAQHLLRAAGAVGLTADGRFGAAMEDAVRTFQTAHDLADTGLVAGGSWPLLAVPVRADDRGERGLAVEALLAGRRAGAPDVVDARAWRGLLA